MSVAPLRIGRVIKLPPARAKEPATRTPVRAAELDLVVAPAPGKKSKKNPERPEDDQSRGELQDYWGRLVALIPAEVLSIYLVGNGIIPAGTALATAVWALICLGLVVLARAHMTSDKRRKIQPEWASVAISSLSFVIWVYNMPGPFQAYGLAVPYIGSLAVLVWTFVVPFVYKGKDVTYRES